MDMHQFYMFCDGALTGLILYLNIFFVLEIRRIRRDIQRLHVYFSIKMGDM